MNPTIPNADATCLSPWALYLLAEHLLPSSSIISRSLISFSVYSPPISSTTSLGLLLEGGLRDSFKRRQLVPSFVEPTTYSHYDGMCVYKRVRYCVQLENTMLVLTEKCSDVDNLPFLFRIRPPFEWRREGASKRDILARSSHSFLNWMDTERERAKLLWFFVVCVADKCDHAYSLSSMRSGRERDTMFSY